MKLCGVCELWGITRVATWAGFWGDGNALALCDGCNSAGAGRGDGQPKPVPMEASNGAPVLLARATAPMGPESFTYEFRALFPGAWNRVYRPDGSRVAYITPRGHCFDAGGVDTCTQCGAAECTLYATGPCPQPATVGSVRAMLS